MEDFIPFDLKKKLEEKGFKTENTDWCYLDGNLIRVRKYVNISPYEYASTISQVLKWLRKEKKIHLKVEIWEGGWYFEVFSFSKHEDDKKYESEMLKQSSDYDSYELSALAGIEYVLDNLI